MIALGLGFAAYTYVMTRVSDTIHVNGETVAGEIASAKEAGESSVEGLTPEQAANWQSFKQAAIELAPQYDYPVKVIIAQAALESRRGTSRFARERFNYFGIGAFDSNPDRAYTYDNMEHGIIEYMRFVKERFPEAYAARSNPDRMIELLVDNKMGRKYATDPDYVAKLRDLPEWKEY